MRYFALTTLCLLLVACVSTQDSPDELMPPNPARQTELTRLYDQFGGPEKAASDATRRAVAGDDRDRRFTDSLWGTRPKSALGARRYGNALAAGKHHAEALEWLQRAYAETPLGDESLAWIRYEMAQQYMALGKREDAVNLLANRLGATPLPAELQKKYDALIDEAARG